MFTDPPLHVRPLAEPVFLDREKAKGSVLLLHGFASSPYTMRGLGTLLFEAGYRVLIPRLPGHGSRIEDFSKSRYTDWQESVHESLLALRRYPEPVAALGRSFGGALLLLELAAHPEMADALILLATPRPEAKQRLLQKILPVVGLFTKTVPKPWAKPEERVERMEVGRYVGFSIPALREFFATMQLLTPVVLRSIRLPALVLQGTIDTIAKPDSARYFYDGLGKSEKKQILLIDDVGHSPGELHSQAKLQQGLLTFLKEYLHRQNT